MGYLHRAISNVLDYTMMVRTSPVPKSCAYDGYQRRNTSETIAVFVVEII